MFCILNANAWEVSFSDDDQTATLTWVTSSEGQSNNFDEEFPDETGTKLLAAKTLIFKTEEGAEITNLNAFQGKDFAATTVDFSDAHFQETAQEEIKYTKYDPETKTYDTNAKYTPYSNCMAFYYFSNVENAILSKHVKSIWEKCFGFPQDDSKTYNLHTVEIPSNIEYIAHHSFDNVPLTSITIPATVVYIANAAFQNNAIKNLVDVTVEGYTAAASQAFDMKLTVGQTDADYKYYATLHFTAGHEDYFTNTNHPLTQEISLDKGRFQTWLLDHSQASNQGEYPNGWKEFINSGSNEPTPVPVPTDKKVVLRTFSDNVARMVPVDFRAYIVTGVKTVDDNCVLELKQIFGIPAYTGVILYGEVKGNSDYVSMQRIPSWDDKDAETYVAPYNRKSHDKYEIVNYLVPTVTNTKIYPYYKDATDLWGEDAEWPLPAVDGYYNTTTEGSVTDRNFIMTTLKTTSLSGKLAGESYETEDAVVPDGKTKNYVGFFRTKAGLTCGPNKAYLSLPKKLYTKPKGFEALVIRPTQPDDMIFREYEWNKIVSSGNWGLRNDGIGVLESKITGEVEEEETTGISNVDTELEEYGDYYTIQGVKVANPQKGIYIKNGKKVIVK